MHTMIIPDPITGEDYLKRTVILKTRWLSVYWHEFLIPDRDRALHSHPWRLALSLIVTGSYLEYRKGRGPKRMRWFNMLRRSDYHRVAQLHGRVRTLFVGIGDEGGWNFLVKGQEVDRHEYFAQLREERAA